MNTKVNDSLSEDDGDDDKKQNTEYVAIVDEDESSAVSASDESHDEDDGEGEDARLNDDNEDREQIRMRRKEEKAERAQRRKAAMERDKNELNYLRQIVAEQERRMRNLEHNTATQKFVALEQRIQEAAEEVKAAEYIISQAANAGNGEDMVQAIRIRDEAIAAVKQLQGYKARAQQQPRQQQQAQQRPQGEPISLKLAKDWADSNQWFDPNGGDEKSKKMLEIDKGLINEGYNPDSLDYWRELDKRAALLRRGRGGPPIGSSREHVSSAGRNEVYLSPERVDALKQLGVYGDKAAMAPYLKQYAKWDRENKSTR